MAYQTNNKKDKPMPLEGVRIVEYGVFHAGPGAGAILGDLGADVIKIEDGIGDPARHWTDVGGIDFCLPDGDNVWYHIANRNKKGIYLDIKKEKGKEILFRLIEEADVFLTNLRSSTKTSLGIDYETMRGVNPKIIHANVSGYGPEGPVKDLGAYDPMGQARSGIMYITGAENPALLNIAVLDQATAISASHAILTALFFRERHGIGQEIHVSLYSTGLWLMYPNMVLVGSLSIDPNLGWDRLKNSPLRNRFCCQDGKWIIGAHHPEEKYWPSFCEATDQGKLLSDPRFKDHEGRRDNCPELISIFDKVFASRTRDEWMEIFLSHNLMFSPVQRINEVLEDPQALINDYVVDFEHPVLGKVKIPGYPVHFSAARAGTQSLGPGIGEHTDQIMHWMNYADQDIKKLKKEEIIR
ncbi:MAG: CoA transferase [Thermodesulfobacteriota bacterium]|nr:CoA transferase [Thermodesulfobacteriota bacterium]